MIAAVCSIKRNNQKIQTIPNALKSYAESCELNTIVSAAEKSLVRQGYRIEKLGHVESIEKALEVCKQRQISSLYVAKHQVPQSLPVQSEEILIQYI